MGCLLSHIHGHKNKTETNENSFIPVDVFKIALYLLEDYRLEANNLFVALRKECFFPPRKMLAASGDRCMNCNYFLCVIDRIVHPTSKKSTFI